MQAPTTTTAIERPQQLAALGRSTTKSHPDEFTLADYINRKTV